MKNSEFLSLKQGDNVLNNNGDIYKIHALLDNDEMIVCSQSGELKRIKDEKIIRMDKLN